MAGRHEPYGVLGPQTGRFSVHDIILVFQKQAPTSPQKAAVMHKIAILYILFSLSWHDQIAETDQQDQTMSVQIVSALHHCLDSDLYSFFVFTTFRMQAKFKSDQPWTTECYGPSRIRTTSEQRNIDHIFSWRIFKSIIIIDEFVVHFKTTELFCVASGFV